MSTNGRRGDVSPHSLEPGTRLGRWRVVEPLDPQVPWALRTAAPVPAPGRDAGWAGLLLAGMVLLTCGALTLVRHAPGLLGGGPTAGADTRGAAAGPTPWKNQKRAPCTPKLEVEYSGVCWFPHREQPPRCPPQTVTYESECLLPVPQPRPALPTSLEPVPPGP